VLKGLVVGEGSPAPDFQAVDQNGNSISLSSLKGRIVVLYFYPRAFTSGCTREAERFNTLLEEFGKHGAVVVGVSTDPPERVRRFAEKLGIRFHLVADPEARIVQAYGVARRRGSGRVSAERVTFIIDGEGVVRRVIRGVRPAEKHADLALEAVRELASSSSEG
jgi:peroxiredoxin Q/BCP